jgi:hypothetical protein
MNSTYCLDPNDVPVNGTCIPGQNLPLAGLTGFPLGGLPPFRPTGKPALM